MPQITKLDKTTCRALGLAVAAALKEVGDKYGVSFDYAGGTMKSDVEFDMKLRTRVADPSIAQAAAKQEFDLWCGAYGLEPKHYGARVLVKGAYWTLKGFKPSRHKYPIVMVDAGGKEMLWTTSVVERIKASVQ